RWIDSRVGRFSSMDPKYGCPNNRCGGYIYASADPTNRLDPSGNEDFGSIGAIGIGVGVEASLGEGSYALINSLRRGTHRHIYLRWHSLTLNWIATLLGAHAYVVYDDDGGHPLVFEGEPQNQHDLFDFGRLQANKDEPFPGEPE